jgi:hypothetical protein
MTLRGLSRSLTVALTLFTLATSTLVTRWAAAQAAPPTQPNDDASRAEARKIGYAGVEAYQAGDFATARDRLEAAYQLLRVPSLGLWSARALAKLGKLVEADARYLEVIKLPTSIGDEAVQAQARQDAATERGALARRMPSILVRVLDAPIADVAITVDGEALVGSALAGEHLVNPGSHRVEGVRGGIRARADVIVAEGEQKEALLRFGPALADGAAGVADTRLRAEPGGPGAGGRMRTVGWATLGAGGAGVAVGIVTALVVRSKKNHLDDVGCGDGGQMCPASETANVDSYNSWRPVPTISLLAGAMLAGAGVYLLATTPSPGDASTGVAPAAARRRSVLGNVRVAFGPGGTAVTGEF